MATMHNPDTNTTKSTRTALAALLKRCSERAARDMEAQAVELLQAATRLRNERR